MLYHILVNVLILTFADDLNLRETNLGQNYTNSSNNNDNNYTCQGAVDHLSIFIWMNVD